MCTVVQPCSKFLAVSLFSADNKTYEAQRKAFDHGRSRRETSGTPGASVVEVHSGRKSRKTAQDQEIYFLREEERARQSFKIFSSSSGSSPRPNRSIAAITSVSFVNARILLIVSSRSRCNFRASALICRLPRRDSSAITSRMSSSFVPFAMFKARNDSGFVLTMQLSSLSNSGLRLTRKNAPPYTVCSRWARSSAQRASSHSACTASQSGLPAGISEIRNRSGSL
jgi:hypothetical protein